MTAENIVTGIGAIMEDFEMVYVKSRASILGD